MSTRHGAPTLDDALNIWLKFQPEYTRLITNKSVDTLKGFAGIEFLWCGLQQGPTITREYRNRASGSIFSVCNVPSFYCGKTDPEVRKIEEASTFAFTLDKLHLNRSPNSKEIRTIMKSPQEAKKLGEWSLRGVGQTIKTPGGRVKVFYYPETKFGHPVLFITAHHVFDRINDRAHAARNHNLTWTYWLSSSILNRGTGFTTAEIMSPICAGDDNDVIMLVPPGAIVGSKFTLTQAVAGLPAGTKVFFGMTYLLVNMLRENDLNALVRTLKEYDAPNKSTQDSIDTIIKILGEPDNNEARSDQLTGPSGPGVWNNKG